MKSTTYIIKTLGAAAALLLGACNYLDVAPARKATLEDAMKDKMAVENWIYGCYSADGRQRKLLGYTERPTVV